MLSLIRIKRDKREKIDWLRKISIAGICMVCCISVQAQDELVNYSNDYSTPSKLQSFKGSDYKMETRDGRLHIRHKGKMERMVRGLYNGLDPYTECFDLAAKFELRFAEGNEKSAFGMEFYTFDQKRTTDYFNFIKYMLTGDGKLKFYSGSDEKIKMGDLPASPCPSFNPAELNKVEMIRHKKDWYLIINGDTVKHITETALYPVMHVYTGNFILQGNYEVELDNFSYKVLPDVEAVKKNKENLRTLSGSYLTYSSCLKNSSKRITLTLRYAGTGNKFSLSGLGKDPVTLYLDEKTENTFTQYDNFYVDMGGRNYSVRRLKITQASPGEKHNITFNVFDQDAKTFTDCDFDGDQNFESSASAEETEPAKPTAPAAYTTIAKFHEGLALVSRNKQYGYIDTSGKEVIPLKYAYAADFSGGMADVWANEKHGFINKTGKLIVPIIYDGVFLGYSYGLAAVKQNSKWGFIDNTGKTVIPFNYEEAMFFREGLVAVKQNGKWGYIDTLGKIVIALKYDCGNSFSEGLVLVCSDKKYGYVNLRGEEIIPILYNDTYGFRDGKAKMILNGQPVYYDKTGKKLAE